MSPTDAARRGLKHLGAVWWRDEEDTLIFLNSRDRLYAIDAVTGERGTGVVRLAILPPHYRATLRQRLKQLVSLCKDCSAPALLARELETGAATRYPVQQALVFDAEEAAKFVWQ